MGPAAIILVTMLAFLAAAALPSQSPIESKSFSALPGDSLVIQNDYGRVQIAAWDSSLVDARILRNPPAQAGKESVRVVTQKSGNKIFVYAFFSGSGGESVDLEIRIPRFLNVVIWGANPELDLRGIQGFVRAQTFTGGITAEDLVSSVSLISDSGDIFYRSITQPRGDARLETSSGHIRCELAEKLNVRAWLRAGGAVTWDKEPEVKAASLERQLGTFGPLLYAGSLKGNVVVSLKDAVVTPPPPDLPPIKEATRGTPPADKTPRESPPDPAPPPEVEPERPRLSRKPGTRVGTPVAHPTIDSQPRLPDTRTSPAPVDPKPDSSPPNVNARPPAPASTQQPESTPGGFAVKVAVESVFLNVSVRDQQTNRSIPNLTRDDFQVYEDRVPQQIEQMAPGEAPFNLLLLLDVSGSTRSFLHLMKQASVDFTRQIKVNDRIAVAAFNSNVELMQGFTNDRAAAARAIQRISSGGGTAFYDALLTCIDDYMHGIEGRSAIVVFTDGVDNQLEGNRSEGSRIPFPQLYRRIQEIEPIIYTIFLDTEGRLGPTTQVPSSGNVVIDILGGVLGRGRVPGSYPRRYPTPGQGPGSNPAVYDEAREQLLTIAEQTGGRMYSPNRIEDLSRVYTEIADDLRIQYQLGYNSTNRASDGKWRAIHVEVPNHPGTVVRTRKGYYARRDPARAGNLTP